MGKCPSWTSSARELPMSAAIRPPEAATPIFRNGFATTALALSIVGVGFGLTVLFGLLATVFGALAVLFGVIGVVRARKGRATRRGGGGHGRGGRPPRVRPRG